MITTVCMNPSFDKTASVPSIAMGDVNRLKEVRIDVGGKGINVGIVLKRLGAQTQCLGCLGKENGDAFLRMLEKERLPFDYLSVAGEVRTNLKLLDQSNQLVTEFNEPGVRLTEEENARFLDLLLKHADCTDIFVFSGKLPGGCHEATYRQFMHALSGKKCVIDAAGDTLLYSLQEKPFLIKPNLPELEGMLRTTFRSQDEICAGARRLLEFGAQNVVVSMGKDGAMLVTKEGALYAPALPVVARSTVGAGDAMLGGILAGVDKGLTLSEAFRWGVAAGAASVMTEGTQLIHKQDFDMLLPKVTVQKDEDDH